MENVSPSFLMGDFVFGDVFKLLLNFFNTVFVCNYQKLLKIYTKAYVHGIIIIN